MLIFLTIISILLLLAAIVITIPIFFTTLRGGPPFVPTSMRAVRLMLKAAGLKDGDIVYDIGCGDGRIIIEAMRKYNVRGIGIERSLLVWLLAKLRQIILKSKAQLLYKNMFKVDLSDADTVFCYLLPNTINKLKEKFEKELKIGAKIVSHGFQIEGWKPVYEIKRDKIKKTPSIIVYEIGKSNA